VFDDGFALPAVLVRARVRIAKAGARHERHHDVQHARVHGSRGLCVQIRGAALFELTDNRVFGV